METVTKIIDEVREDMCTNYCKYADDATSLLDDQEALDAICGKCPLNRL